MGACATRVEFAASHVQSASQLAARSWKSQRTRNRRLPSASGCGPCDQRASLSLLGLSTPGEERKDRRLLAHPGAARPKSLHSIASPPRPQSHRRSWPTRPRTRATPGRRPSSRCDFASTPSMARCRCRFPASCATLASSRCRRACPCPSLGSRGARRVTPMASARSGECDGCTTVRGRHCVRR